MGMSWKGAIKEEGGVGWGGGGRFCKVKTPFATRNFQTQPAAANDIAKSRKRRRGGFKGKFCTCVQKLRRDWNVCLCASLWFFLSPSTHWQRSQEPFAVRCMPNTSVSMLNSARSALEGAPKQALCMNVCERCRTACSMTAVRPIAEFTYRHCKINELSTQKIDQIWLSFSRSVFLHITTEVRTEHMVNMENMVHAI